MSDPGARFLEGFISSYKASSANTAATKKADAKAKIDADKAAEAKLKQDKTDAKAKYTTYKTRVDNIITDAEEDSPLYKWGQEVKRGIDQGLMIIENPDLGDANFDQDVTLKGWEDEYLGLIDAHGSVKTAGLSIDPSIVLNRKEKALKESKEDEYATKFNNYDLGVQRTILDNNEMVKTIVEKGVYDNHYSYVAAIRKQYQDEDLLPDAVKENVKNIKRQLQEYHTRSVWEEFKANSILSADTVALFVEGMGVRPVFPLDDEGEATYNKLMSDYQKIMKDYSGFDTFWVPEPVNFIEDPNDPKKMVASYGNATDPGILEFNLDQIKDRNKIIDNVAAKRIVKDVQQFTGKGFTELNTTVDFILDNPDERDKYKPEFISSLEDINVLFDELQADLNIDFSTLTYGKVDFIEQTPDDPKAEVSRYISDKEREELEGAGTSHPGSSTMGQYHIPTKQ